MPIALDRTCTKCEIPGKLFYNPTDYHCIDCQKEMKNLKYRERFKSEKIDDTLLNRVWLVR